MAHTIQKFIGEWDTMHNNGPYPTQLLLDTFIDDSLPTLLEKYNNTGNEIRDLIQEALNKNQGFRAMGSRWSLNHIAHHKERIHHNRNMNIIMPATNGDMAGGSNYRSEDIFFLQCGVRIKEISAYLLQRKKSLKTTGASNGQTIAGCISTGVHGSAIDTGSIQDYVVGINLINGPGPQDNIYIERASKPVFNDGFIQSIQARAIRDDDIFHAALVGLGAFGFIHGIVIETEDIFLLKRYIGTISKANAILLSESLNFEKAHTLIQTHQNALAAEVDPQGKGLRPYHFKLILNPYHSKSDFYAEVMYKKPYRPDYPNPIPLIKQTINPDILTFMTKLLTGNKWAIPKIIQALRKTIFPNPDMPPIEGTVGEIFFDALHQGPAFAFEIAFDHGSFGKVLDIFVDTLIDKNKGYLPGAVGVRFVKGTNATLGFTRFPHTCVMEVDGTLPVPKSKTRKKAMEQLYAFSRNITDLLKANQIAFTFHWGKTADWQQAGLIDYMYGAKKIEWMQKREGLFPSPQLAKMFTNDFLQHTGLV